MSEGSAGVLFVMLGVVALLIAGKMAKVGDDKATIWMIAGFVALGVGVTTWNKTSSSPAASVTATPVQSRSSQVASLSAAESKLYGKGLQHLQNSHAIVGSYSVAEIVADERSREAQRDEATATSGENADIKAAFQLADQSPLIAALVHDVSIDGKTLTFTVDADYWNPMSDQDRTLFKRTMYNVWSTSYNQRHHTSGEHVILNLDNLAGDRVDAYY